MMRMNIQQTIFGTTLDGSQIRKFAVSNDHGTTASFINFGAILTSLKVPDRNGKAGEVTLGFDTLEDYIADKWFFGSTIGRYANRIAKGQFTLDGVKYQLAQNSPPSHLHGGDKGFHKVAWNADTQIKEDSIAVVFSRLSPDGEEGYPGNLSVTVTYILNNQDELMITYRAETDKATPINLTNHTYWNLKGASAGNVLDHVLILNADDYLPTDDERIPTGELKSVHGTPMDFTQPVKIGARIGEVKGGGYNHCYVLRKQLDSLSLAATVHEPITGRIIEIYTTEPGMQFYSGHFLDRYKGAGGIIFNKYDGFCLEAQHFPNSVNEPQFPSTILRPGSIYKQTTIYKFYLKK
jgi:aldose 1-epimerase